MKRSVSSATAKVPQLGRRRSKPSKSILFWSYWDSLGGPGFNGGVEIIRRGIRYYVITTNNSLEPPETVYGPFSSFEAALVCEDASALMVGPGTYEVGSTEFDTSTLLTRLQVYLPDEEEIDAWDITVNGQKVQASRNGFSRTPSSPNNPRTHARHPPH